MLFGLHNLIKTFSTSKSINIISVLTELTDYVSKNFETNLPEKTEFPKRKATVVFEHCLHKELCFEL